MALPGFLSSVYTPSFLMGLCKGLTDFEAHDVVQPFLGRWVRVRGSLFQATPNPAFGTAGVTIEFPDEGEGKLEAFLTFTHDLDRLASVRRDETILAEGQIKSISERLMVLENCGLTTREMAAILEVSHRADELKKTAQNWHPRLAGEPQPEAQANPEPGAPVENETEKRQPDERTPVAAADAERFARFILEMWPDISEREAHDRAVRFFHDRRVTRDWFWSIFRPIRGYKKPGRVRKTKK